MSIQSCDLDCKLEIVLVLHKWKMSQPYSTKAESTKDVNIFTKRFAKSIGQIVHTLKGTGKKTVAKMKAVKIYVLQDFIVGRSP